MKAILLVRVSTQHQDLVQQTDKVKAEALKDGFSSDDIIIIEDKESAVKLSEEERNGLNKLKWHVEHDDISTVYVYEISRLSRRPSVVYSIRDYLIKHHVQLIVMNPYMRMLKDDGTLSETANIFFGIFASMAENEGYIRQSRMMRGKEKKKEQGFFVGSRVPLGYKVVDHKLQIDENEAPIIRRIFKDYANGISLRKLAKQLNAEGWRRGTTVPTLQCTIRNILHRKYYYGDKTHPAIISKEEYDKTREQAIAKTSYKTDRPNEALLKGLIRDKDTGYRLSSNQAIKQYYCRDVGKTTVTFKAAHMFVWGVVKEWYSNIYIVKKDEYVNNIKEQIRRNENIVRTMENNIIANQDKIDRIEERYIEGKINKERADILEKKTFEDMQYYRKAMNEANNEIIRLTNSLNDEHIVGINDNMTAQEKIEVIRTIVKQVVVTRLEKYILEMMIENKVTGEQRTLIINTKKCEILDMKVKTRPTLSYNK